MTKRQLKLLPEVLPDPRASKPTGPTPRERTTRRLQQLLSIAAVGVLSTPGCGGDKNSGYMVVDPMPTPVCSLGADELSVSAKWERMQGEGTQGEHTERDVIRIEIVAVQPSSFESSAPASPASPPVVGGGELVSWSSSGQSFVAVIAPKSNTSGGLSINFQVQRAGSRRVDVFLMQYGPGSDILVTEVCVR